MATLCSPCRLQRSALLSLHVSRASKQVHARREFHASPPKKFIEAGVSGAHTLLESVHTFTGLPWYLAIPATTFAVRTVFTLPLAIYSRRRQQRRTDLMPLLRAWGAVNRRNRTGPDVSKMVAETRIDFFRKRSEIFRRWDVQVWKSFLVTSGQIPIFLLMIETLRRMSGFGTGILGMISHPFDSSLYGQADRSTVLEELSQSATVPIEQSFSTGGILSFENLLLPDTALALPFVLSASVLANLYLAQWNIRGERSTMMRRIDKITKMVALALGPLTLHFPSALVIYLISNSVYSGVQQMVFQKAMPIPTIPEPCKPKSKVTKKAAVAGI